MTCNCFIVLITKPLLKDLSKIVTPDYAVHWKTFGTHLGIRSGVLDTIDHDCYHKAEDCCNAVWEEWLDTDTNASWYRLIQIIDSPAVVGAIKNTEVASADMDVSIHSAVLSASDQLRQFHNNERYKSIGDDDWPLYQPDHFTSVALIHHKEKHITNREVIAVATRTYKGDVEIDINNDNSPRSTNHPMDAANHEKYFMGCQSTKDITEIFKYASSQESNASNNFKPAPNLILIEGAPGIGKTILSKEIAFQWANKNLLSNTLLLFLIFLRDPYVKYITSLKEFVRYAICSSEQNKNVSIIAQYLEDTSGSYLTIVFDGYDEISEEIRHNSFIASIINRKILKLCGLVITSRPTASTVLHSVCDCRVEILGFTKEDRMKYIKQSLEGNPNEATQLEDYLEKNPFINSLCYIPLNMTILICLFKEFSENRSCMLPKNQTEMNEQFICIMISRFLKKRHITLTITSLKKLPAPYKQQFKNLSKLAFCLLHKDQIVFNDDDINHVNWSDLGLLKTVRYSNYLKHDPVTSYNFLHFSLQEFMSAYYVTTLFPFNQVKVIKDHFWESRYLNSRIMYVGLTKDVSFALKHFLIGHT